MQVGNPIAMDMWKLQTLSAFMKPLEDATMCWFLDTGVRRIEDSHEPLLFVF